MGERKLCLGFEAISVVILMRSRFIVHTPSSNSDVHTEKSEGKIAAGSSLISL